MNSDWRNPKYPVYIISKGRWEYPYTIRALEKRGVSFYVVVEPQEADRYAEVVDPENILTLPFSNLGWGSIPARNWVWEDAIKRGWDYHWILDDNINEFYYLHQNMKWRTRSGFTFRIIEEFVERFENIALAGMHYAFFAPRKSKWKPFIWNSRIYSCIFIRNDLPFRWRGRYNEDTDLSLRVLKAGWCTILFRSFLAGKLATMKLPGGNTDTIYKEGVRSRTKMTLSLQLEHPDVVRATWKWGRWHHYVDYSRFQRNIPRLKPDAQPLNIQDLVQFIVFNDEEDND